MSTADYITYIGLFVFVLATQLGRRQVSARKLVMPLVLVGAIGAKYLVHLPAGSMGHLLEAGGLLAGLIFGFASIAVVKVSADPATGRPYTTAGWGYAAVWTVALAGRMAFAYGSAHWFTAPLAAFSAANHVPGTAYAAAFVLMVLAMIAVRSTAVALRSYRTGAPVDWNGLSQKGIGRRIAQRINQRINNSHSF
jgi:hypothetical protein